jgi:hypothetical protein
MGTRGAAAWGLPTPALLLLEHDSTFPAHLQEPRHAPAKSAGDAGAVLWGVLAPGTHGPPTGQHAAPRCAHLWPPPQLRIQLKSASYPTVYMYTCIMLIVQTVPSVWICTLFLCGTWWTPHAAAATCCHPHQEGCSSAG